MRFWRYVVQTFARVRRELRQRPVLTIPRSLRGERRGRADPLGATLSLMVRLHEEGKGFYKIAEAPDSKRISTKTGLPSWSGKSV